MTVEEAVISRLLTLSGVTTAVGQKVYALKFPQSVVFPAVRVSHISEVTTAHLRGAGALKRTRVQIDSVVREGSGDYIDTATDLSTAIEGDGGGSGSGSPSGLSGWTGTIGDVDIKAIFKIDSTQLYEAGAERTIRISDDYMVHWAPAA